MHTESIKTAQRLVMLWFHLTIMNSFLETHVLESRQHVILYGIDGVFTCKSVVVCHQVLLFLVVCLWCLPYFERQKGGFFYEK